MLTSDDMEEWDKLQNDYKGVNAVQNEQYSDDVIIVNM